jgi:lipoate-protein ligase B
LNVCGDLSPFNYIVPCGISSVAITSMEEETKKSFTVAEVAREIEKLALDSIVSLRVAPEAQLINA